MTAINFCEHCLSERSVLVTDTRQSEKFSGAVLRRRRCSNCGHRFTTYEVRVDDLEKIEQIAVRERDAYLLGVIETAMLRRPPK